MLLDVDAWLARCPPRLRPPLMRCAAGEISTEMALMHLVIGADRWETLAALFDELDRRLNGQVGAAATRLGALGRTARQHRHAWPQLKAILGALSHHEVSASPTAALARWRAAFDDAVAISPEASVALYSLGDAGLLAAATAEIVERLAAWGLLGRDRRLLEIGCGIGRFLSALAESFELLIGIDISRRMAEYAHRRCAGLDNVHVLQCGGQDLAFLADASIDLVLAADSFPYLVQSGGDLPARHMREAARVLRPGGDLLVLNFSYRGDLDRDRADARCLAEAAGLAVLREGSRDFVRWDGSTFHFRKTDR
jgi:SAM-dependent methyltransferase